MAIEAVDWSVVVTGAWNVAILTPDGIRKRLFELPDGSPVSIEIAIDRPGSFRVRHEGVIVELSPLGLIISGDPSNLQTLTLACQVAQKALTSLPETPVTATGINFKFRTPDLPNSVLDLLECRLDDLLSDNNHVIVGRTLKRVIDCDSGVINLEISQKEGSESTISFNFHLGSTQSESLTKWLTRVKDFDTMAKGLLGQFGFTEGE